MRDHWTYHITSYLHHHHLYYYKWETSFVLSSFHFSKKFSLQYINTSIHPYFIVSFIEIDLSSHFRCSIHSDLFQGTLSSAIFPLNYRVSACLCLSATSPQIASRIFSYERHRHHHTNERPWRCRSHTCRIPNSYSRNGIRQMAGYIRMDEKRFTHGQGIRDHVGAGRFGGIKVDRH